MKVSKLKEILKGVPDDYEVILATDEEGNKFSPLCNSIDYAYSIGHYEPQTTWGGDFYTEDSEIEEFIENSIVLWPTN